MNTIIQQKVICQAFFTTIRDFIKKNIEMLQPEVVNRNMPDSNQDIDPFINAINIMMKEWNVNQYWLASEIGKKQQYISMIVNGKRKAPIQTREKIAKAFKLDYCEFYNLGRKEVDNDLTENKKSGGRKENKEKRMEGWKEAYYAQIKLIEKNKLIEKLKKRIEQLENQLNMEIDPLSKRAE